MGGVLGRSGGPRIWPVRLNDGDLTLRPLKVSDEAEWTQVRQENAFWLAQWEATMPPDAPGGPSSFRDLARRLAKEAKAGRVWPFVIEVDGRLVGQVTVSNVVRGSAQSASVGYWISEDFAGHGYVPRAVALAIDHCFVVAGLHRIEICVRPENTNSLRVVEKLGLGEVGFAPRMLHINGSWADHRIFAVTREEVPAGMLMRLRMQREDWDPVSPQGPHETQEPHE